MQPPASRQPGCSRRPASPPLATYRVRALPALGVSAFLGFLCLLPLSLPFVQIQSSLEHHESNLTPILAAAVVGTTVFAVAVFLLGPFIVRTVRLVGARFLIYPEGLALQWPWYFRLVAWDEIASVRQYGAAAYWLQIRNGPLFFLDPYVIPGLNALGTVIQQSSFPFLFEQAWAILQAGGQIHFGRVGIDPEGIDSGTDWLAWSEVETVEVEPGGSFVLYRIGRRTPWLIGSTYHVPNFRVFFACIRHLLPEKFIEADEAIPAGSFVAPDEEARPGEITLLPDNIRPSRSRSTSRSARPLSGMLRPDPLWDRIDGLPREALPVLGKPIADYPATWGSRWRGLAAALPELCLLIGVGMLPLLLRWVNCPLSPGWEFGLSGSCCVFLGLRLREDWKEWRGRVDRLLLYPEGFVVVRKTEVTGCRWERISWYEITEETGNILAPERPYLAVNVVRDNGRFWKLTSFVNGLQPLLDELTRRLLDWMRRQWDAGETIVCGNLGVSREGLVAGGFCRWSDLILRVEKQTLHVSSRHTFELWFRLPFRRSPNGPVLMQLLAEKGLLSLP